MLNFNDEENKFSREKIEKKNKFFDYRIYTMKKKFYNNDKIFSKINNNMNSIKNNTNILLGIKKIKINPKTNKYILIWKI